MTSHGSMSGVLAGLLALVASSASAVPITASFTVGGFSDKAPSDLVSGTMVWEADSPTSPIKSLTSINLTIGDHAYTLEEVGFVSLGDPSYLIGGNLNGIYSMLPGTDDFVLVVDGAAPRYLMYSSGGYPFLGQGFTSFSVTASAVPEPGTFALLGVALGAMAFVRRRRAR